MAHPWANRLGRLPAVDERDKKYPFSLALVPKDLSLVWRYWRTGPILDQGDTSECVAYSWRQWLTSGPVRNKAVDPTPDHIYASAQAIDEWAGSPHDGTSVRAGAKVLSSEGFIPSYLWSQNITDFQAWIMSHGPVVIGTDWFEDMFNPNSKGVVNVTGPVAGGHAYLVNGWNSDTKMFRCTNSWGKGWGVNGRFWIKEADMQNLVYNRDGECCTAVEVIP